MAGLKTSRPLENFVRLNQAVYFHQPESTSPKNVVREKDPDVIILAAWMNALPKHLAKYAATYATLYPGAKILIVFTNSLDATIRTESGNLNRVKPVLEILYSLDKESEGEGEGEGKGKRRVLWHLFSNGGGFTSTFIASEYQKKIGKVLPITALILDSSPGRANVEATIRAFAVSLPRNAILNLLGMLLLRFFFVIIRIGYMFRKTPNTIELLRIVLNDRKCFAVEAPRLYVYSEGDEMVDWRDVEEHGEEAEGRGYIVSRVKYTESGHAAHMINDPKRYWGAVRRLWDSAA